jgi:hypothetical protein
MGFSRRQTISHLAFEETMFEQTTIEGRFTSEAIDEHLLADPNKWRAARAERLARTALLEAAHAWRRSSTLGGSQGDALPRLERAVRLIERANTLARAANLSEPFPSHEKLVLPRRGTLPRVSRAAQNSPGLLRLVTPPSKI